jgi:hypothetical protein
MKLVIIESGPQTKLPADNTPPKVTPIKAIKIAAVGTDHHEQAIRVLMPLH